MMRFKIGCFSLEALNSFATAFYFYYLFFFMGKEFGFTDRHNLGLAAVNGFVYMLSARFGGRYGQQRGYFKGLRLGFAVMAAMLVLGAFLHTAWGQLLVLIGWTLGICFTWPTLEALVSEYESPARLPKIIGIYNVVWGVMSSLAYFTGGAMLEHLGGRSIFWVPVLLHVVQIMLSWVVERWQPVQGPAQPLAEDVVRLPLNPRPIAKARMFLKMAWLANPFAYVAINTVAAVIPTVARNLQLTPMFAGFFCSVWFFARLATFIGLWLWEGWHYRFRWFLAAYVMLLGGFACILLVPNLAIVILAQVAFGVALGLMYYASLFYSMDAGEAKGEHGGIHEAAIGAGIFAGPAVAATALSVFPAHPSAGTLAVTGLLLAGLAGVLVIRWRGLHRP